LAFLVNPEVIQMQAQFILERFEKSINTIIKISDSPRDVLVILRNIAGYSDQALLLLMDYVNFK
jgi:hypothetical protein